MISPNQVDDWLSLPAESQQLEFKEAKNGFSLERLYGYCVAISNEGGGKLILGATDKHPRLVVGTQAFPNLVKVTKQIFEKLHFRVDVSAIDHPKGRVLVFEVPGRPNGTPRSLDGAFLMRNGDQLVPMTADVLTRIVLEGQPDWLELPALRALSGEEIPELLDTESLFQLLKIPQPSNLETMLDRLKQERLIHEVLGEYQIPRISAVLFARKLSDFPDVFRKAPRVIVYNGQSKTSTKLEKSGSRGYAVGFKRQVDFIGEQLPQNEQIEGAFRTKVKLVPDEVIRELLANALIHQDFGITGTAVLVEIFSDRIDISNPGSPLIRVERFADENRSRNERLASLMRRIGFCEEKGSGIDRVLETIEAYQLPAPSIRADEYRTKITIFGPKKFENLTAEDRIGACYWHCVLKWVMGQRMTNQTLRERFKLSPNRSSTVSQLILSTVKANRIKRDASVGESLRLARYIPFWA